MKLDLPHFTDPSYPGRRDRLLDSDHHRVHGSVCVHGFLQDYRDPDRSCGTGVEHRARRGNLLPVHAPADLRKSGDLNEENFRIADNDRCLRDGLRCCSVLFLDPVL